MNIVYRQLIRDELEKFRQIDRREVVREVYHLKDGKLRLHQEYYDIQGFDRLEERIADLKNDFDNGTVMFGAFDGDRLVGLGSLGSRLWRKERDTAQLEGLHVSQDFRGKGIGHTLVNFVLDAAKMRNIRKVYVTATPSKNTVDFYVRIGFELASEVIPELFEKEPDDIHLELYL